MKDEIKEILDDYKQLAGGITEKLDNTAEYESWLIIQEYFDKLKDYITNLQEEKDKFKLRCYKALKLIRDNYGLLDKYGIDMIDDILNGGDDKDGND